jgi:D-arabinose 1-dehydrogenase-like Zn-dependent alcohol dehydrogenase
MKALVLKGPNAPFEMSEVPDPVAGPGEAVARVFACGSGLTIQHVKAGRLPVQFPRIIGHEITGEIVQTGAGVKSVAVGDPVTAYAYLNCGHCRWCLSNLEPLCENTGGGTGMVGMACDGGYAQYIKLPAHVFLKLPDGVDYKAHPAEIGVVTDALATPYKVLGRAQVKAGETVAVFGAGGGVGIHQLMLAKWARARVIAVDVAPDKFEACRKAGADEVVNASDGDVVRALLDLTHGRGIDVAIDYVSVTSTLEAAAKSLARRGRMVTLGGAGKSFQVSSFDMLYKEQALLGSRYVTRREILETFDLVARGEIWPIVTDIRPWTEAEAIHARVERGEVIGRAALLIS